MFRIKRIIFLFTITFLLSNYKDFTDAFIDVSKKSNPAIVSIISERDIEPNNPFRSHPFFEDDFFPKDFFQFPEESYKSNTLTKELAGPIGMVKMADQLMLDKIKGVLFIFIMISLFVGLFNLVPVPLLDGGHIVYFLLRSFFSNSLPAYVTRIYLITGITIISFLFIIITFNDIFYK